VPSKIGKALEGIGGLIGGIRPQAVPVTPEPVNNSGPGSQLDPPAGRHAGLEGRLTGSGGPVHDAAIGDGEGRAVPGAGHAGSAPFNDDPSLV